MSHCLPRAKLMMMMRIRAQLESGPIRLICDFIAMKFILVFFLLFLFPFALFTFAPKPVSVSLFSAGIFAALLHFSQFSLILSVASSLLPQLPQLISLHTNRDAARGTQGGGGSCRRLMFIFMLRTRVTLNYPGCRSRCRTQNRSL